MKIETGEPRSDGRYVVFVKRELSDYVEPLVADRLHGRWLWIPDVLGWIGPFPTMTVDNFKRTHGVAFPCGGKPAADAIQATDYDL